MADKPYDDAGRFVPLECPVCGGKLVYQGHGAWECDGLIDPEDLSKELQCCTFDHIDGHRYLGERKRKTRVAITVGDRK